MHTEYSATCCKGPCTKCAAPLEFGDVDSVQGPAVSMQAINLFRPRVNCLSEESFYQRIFAAVVAGLLSICTNNLVWTVNLNMGCFGG